MGTVVQPYLFFGGRCEEAVEFYCVALGAQVEMLMKFKDAPEKPPEGTLVPGYENKVMHSSFRVGDSTVMASDGCGPEGKFDGFSLSISLGTEAETEKAFQALAAGGEVTMPLSKTFWSPKFGMLKDKFGINWMVSVPGK
jgi:PhnB protein